jgi:NitT/TauT family transport system substrate-binding protein
MTTMRMLMTGVEATLHVRAARGIRFAGAMLLAALAGTAAAAPEVTDITVYSSLDTQAPVQLITAQRKGFFKEAGLNVTTKYYQSATDIPPGMIGGSIVLAHGGLLNALVVADQGFAVKVESMVADYQRSTQLVIRKDLANLAPAQLAGKTLVGPDVPVVRYFWVNWAKAEKLDPASVKWLNTAPSDAVAAFISNRADMLLAWAPHTTNAVKAGGVLWQDGRSSYRSGKPEVFPVYHNWGVVFASADWARKNPRTLEAYLGALYRAQEYMKCHKEEVAGFVASETRLNPTDTTALMDLNTYLVRYAPDFLDEAQQWAGYFQQAGVLKRPHNVRDLVDTGTIEAAAKAATIPADWLSCGK